MTNKVLVTGGCGFIGSQLVKDLHTRGYDVRILDNLRRGKTENLEDLLNQNNIELIKGDIRDREIVSAAMKDANYVFHLAATCLNRSIKYPTESLRVNLIGANTVFNVAVDNNVEKIMYASSASVYGEQSIPMSENDTVSPQTPYGISKYCAELLADFYASQENIPFIGYRFFNVYGKNQDTDAYYTSVINTFIKRLIRGESPVIHGSGDQTMDFVNVRDVSRALCLGIETDVENEVFNVGSGNMTSITDLAEILIDIVGDDVQPKYKQRNVLVSKRQASTQKAKKSLGFESEVPIKDGLEEVVKFVASEMDTKNKPVASDD
jgi:UDP-glucose 4-epimerase